MAFEGHQRSPQRIPQTIPSPERARWHRMVFQLQGSSLRLWDLLTTSLRPLVHGLSPHLKDPPALGQLAHCHLWGDSSKPRQREGGGAMDVGPPAGWEEVWRRRTWLLVHSTLHHPQDLGLEGTLLTDILYRNVAFLNLVDPISHDLLVNLARDLQCPKTVRLVGKDLRLGSLVDRGHESPGLGVKSLGPHLVCFKALGGSLPLSGTCYQFRCLRLASNWGKRESCWADRFLSDSKCTRP